MPTNARHRVQRVKARARYDRASIHAILDAGQIAHVAFCVDAQPFVIPMLYVRDAESLLLHGSIASRLLKTVGAGIDACIAVTLLDGLVLARSHFHHSMNYRSVVAFGRATAVVDPDAKSSGLLRLVEAMIPGRAAESRPPDRNELAATSLLHFEIDEASAKVRSGGPKDDPADLDLPHWAGVVPQCMQFGDPEPASGNVESTWPASVRNLLASKLLG
ncbi:MAG: pyridoxamine 5'-phosphate oxidase family protein [Rhodanobacteraceae bacterium]